mmetsp:Transcript_120345/g.384203  ORF Transcript_120345/g.384203 Transcript_120345/m.384203 type:complete len:221 (+) Transcript_120345:1839-2501(+)
MPVLTWSRFVSVGPPAVQSVLFTLGWVSLCGRPAAAPAPRHMAAPSASPAPRAEGRGSHKGYSPSSAWCLSSSWRHKLITDAFTLAPSSLIFSPSVVPSVLTDHLNSRQIWSRSCSRVQATLCDPRSSSNIRSYRIVRLWLLNCRASDSSAADLGPFEPIQAPAAESVTLLDADQTYAGHNGASMFEPTSARHDVHLTTHPTDFSKPPAPPLEPSLRRSP